MQLWQTKMSLASSDSAQVDKVCKQATIDVVHLVQYMLEVNACIIQDNV